MKRIICYGDSNTYGYNPYTQGRYEKSIRWTGVLAQELGTGYEIIEEGLNNRTTVLQPEGEPWRSGLYYLEPCLRSQIPIDLFVLMLGSNDMKTVFHQTAEEIGEHIRQLIQEIKRITIEKNPSRHACQILLIAPIFVSKNIVSADYADEFGGLSAVTLSHKIADEYEKIAKEEGCFFLRGGDYAQPSQVDGLHLDEKGHKKMAQAVSEVIHKIW